MAHAILWENINMNFLDLTRAQMDESFKEKIWNDQDLKLVWAEITFWPEKRKNLRPALITVRWLQWEQHHVMGVGFSAAGTRGILSLQGDND